MEDPLSITIRAIAALAVLALGVGLIMLARAIYSAKKSIDKISTTLSGLAHDARPALDRARAVGENLNFIVMSVRKEVDRAGKTMSRANDRLEDALQAAEQRVQEMTALIDIVQGEVEDTLVTASSALRGIRTGAKLLTSKRRRNEEESSSVEDDDE